MTCHNGFFSFRKRTMVTFTCIFVFLTLLFTGLATMFLTLSLLSEFWECMSYNEKRIEEIAMKMNHTFQKINDGLLKLEIGTSKRNDSVDNNMATVIYLVPAHGGINSLCTDISDVDRKTMKEDGFDFNLCISYLSNDDIQSMDSWLDRMRNLAMSCSMVCLILLGSSAPLGILGIIKKQVSTIMVTGVMYMLAAVFGIFTLAFMHFKRVKPQGHFTNTVLDKDVPEDYLKTRHFTSGWPSQMGWVGLSLCIIASIFWLLLAKILRFQISLQRRII